MNKPIKTFIFISLNYTVTHYGSTNTLPLTIEGEHIFYDCKDILPEEIKNSIEKDQSKYSIIRNWTKFWKSINISNFTNEY